MAYDGAVTDTPIEGVSTLSLVVKVDFVDEDGVWEGVARVVIGWTPTVRAVVVSRVARDLIGDVAVIVARAQILDVVEQNARVSGVGIAVRAP